MADDPQDPHRPPGHPEPRPEPGAPGAWGDPTYEPYAPPPAGAPHPPYGAPYGAPPPYPQAHGYGPPVPGGQYSDKSRTTAGLLQLLLPFLGICGVGRLYAGYVGVGVTQLVGVLVSFCLSAFLVGIPFLIGFWVWSVVDGIIMLSSSATKDAQGRLMR